MKGDKNISIIITLVIIFSATLSAKTWNVDNRGIGDFSSIQEAHDTSAVAPGDTLYIIGTSIDYNTGASISKQLIIIGSGYNPQKEHFAEPTVINSILFRTQNSFNPSGSKLIGVKVSAISIYDSGITIDRCEVAQLELVSSPGSFLIQNSIIGFINISTSFFNNIVIRNNVIKRTLSLTAQTSADNNILVTNNLFISNSFESFLSLKFAHIQNNIFVSAVSDILTGGSENNIISNNLTYMNSGSEGDSLIGGYGDVVSDDNLIGINPSFVNYEFGSAFSYNFDFHLKPDSPALTAGSDGTEIGIFGGNYPFETISSGEPRLPVVLYFKTNSGQTTSGILNVNIKAASHK